MVLEERTFAELISTWQDSGRQLSCFAYPAEQDARDCFRYYTVTELGAMTRKAADRYVSQGLHPRRKGEKALVVGLIAAGTPEWAASFFAIIRMGHTPVAINPRLIPSHVGRLIELSNADFVVVDRPIRDLPESLRLLAMMSQKEMDSSSQDVQADTELFCDPRVIDDEDIAYANHSSGSTSCPKLLPTTHRRGMLSFREAVKAFKGDKRLWFGSAFYNTIGLRALIVCLWAAVPSFFENDRVASTAESVIRFAQEAKVDEMYFSPYTLSLLGSTPEGIKEMARTEQVTCFGAVTSDALGDKLVSEGIKLGIQYGMSETMGTLYSKGRAIDDRENWAWMDMMPTKKAFLEMRPIAGQEAGLYELVCLPGCPDVLEEAKEDDGSFFSGDVFQRHPTNPDRWKIIGRKDDQIKIYQDGRPVIVNANEYEHGICSADKGDVSEAVVFGQGRRRLGVLVFTDGKELETRQLVWKAIKQNINDSLPVGIDEGMIVVIQRERSELPQTGKYNLIRSRIYKEYEAEIENAYSGSATLNGHT